MSIDSLARLLRGLGHDVDGDDIDAWIRVHRLPSYLGSFVEMQSLRRWIARHRELVLYGKRPRRPYLPEKVSLPGITSRPPVAETLPQLLHLLEGAKCKDRSMGADHDLRAPPHDVDDSGLDDTRYFLRLTKRH